MTTLLSAEPVEELTELQLRVARRADQLKHLLGARPESDRQVWLRAEFEVLESVERARPATLCAAIAS